MHIFLLNNVHFDRKLVPLCNITLSQDNIVGFHPLTYFAHLLINLLDIDKHKPTPDLVAEICVWKRRI